MLMENNFYVIGSQQQYSNLSIGSDYNIVNNILVVQSEAVISCTVLNPESAVWAFDIVKSVCLNEYNDYQNSTEKILCYSEFLKQNTANPSRFYILCPYFLATESDAIKYIVSKINELDGCPAQSLFLQK